MNRRYRIYTAVLGTALWASGGIVSDYVNRAVAPLGRNTDDELVKHWAASWEDFADSYYFHTLHIGLFLLAIAVLYEFRKTQNYKFAGIFNTITWFVGGDMVDEFNNNAIISADLEYWFGGIGIVCGLCEYHRITPIRTLIERRFEIAAYLQRVWKKVKKASQSRRRKIKEEFYKFQRKWMGLK